MNAGDHGAQRVNEDWLEEDRFAVTEVPAPARAEAGAGCNVSAAEVGVSCNVVAAAEVGVGCQIPAAEAEVGSSDISCTGRGPAGVTSARA